MGRNILAAAIIGGCIAAAYKVDAMLPPNPLGHLARAMAILPERAPPPDPYQLWWKQ